MVFKGERVRYTVQLPGFDFEFAYKLDPTKKPKAIDLEFTSTPDRKGIGMKFQGIYALDGDDLRICYDAEKRPTEFTGKGKSTLVVLKRGQ